MTFCGGDRPEPDKIQYQNKLYMPNQVLFFIDFGQQSNKKNASVYKEEWFGHHLLTTKKLKVGEAEKKFFRTLAIYWSQDLRP